MDYFKYSHFYSKHIIFFHGSFEMFPTEEQEEAAKIFATFLGVLSFTVGALLATCRVKLGRKWRKGNKGETG